MAPPPEVRLTPLRTLDPAVISTPPFQPSPANVLAVSLTAAELSVPSSVTEPVPAVATTVFSRSVIASLAPPAALPATPCSRMLPFPVVRILELSPLPVSEPTSTPWLAKESRPVYSLVDCPPTPISVMSPSFAVTLEPAYTDTPMEMPPLVAPPVPSIRTVPAPPVLTLALSQTSTPRVSPPDRPAGVPPPVPVMETFPLEDCTELPALAMSTPCVPSASLSTAAADANNGQRARVGDHPGAASDIDAVRHAAIAPAVVNRPKLGLKMPATTPDTRERYGSRAGRLIFAPVL